MSAKSKSGSRPRLACEIAADGIIAARVSDSGEMIATCASSNLGQGSLAPDLTENNLRERSDVLRSLGDTLRTVSGRSRDVIAVLPDAAVRVVLLDFETLPTKPEEAEGVVRFRLKKSLPFDVDKARVSYQAQTSGAGVRVIAAVSLMTVIEEYESAFREAGYVPGIVLPSMLAALGAVEAQRPTMVIKVDARTTSIAIMEQEQLLLFRTIENARGVKITGDELAEEVYPSVVFFQDTYQLNLERIYVAGLSETGGAYTALQGQTEATVEELVSSSQLGPDAVSIPKWRMGGVVGALLS